MPLIDPITGAGASHVPSKPSTFNPIKHLQTETAKIIRHLHPVLLLSAYYFQFPALVRDPVSTLLGSLVPLMVVQTVYLVLSLPVAGESGNGNGNGVKKKGKKDGSASRGGGGDVVTRVAMKVFPIITSLLLTQLTIPLLLAIQILFGAPLTTHLAHTTLSSTHFALLAFYPLIYAHGFGDKGKWRKILSLEMGWEGRDELIGGLVGVFVGAWLGAVPIPLDWDREWQRWPVTIVSGGYGGYVVGKVMGGWR